VQKIRNLFIDILLGFLVLVVMIGALILGFRYILGSTDRKFKFPFQDDVEELERTDPDLVTYKEILQIQIDMEKLSGIAAGPGDRIFVSGDKSVLVMSREGKPVRWINLEDPARCIASGGDGTLYVGMTDHVEVFFATGKRKAVWADLGHEALITSIAVKGEDVYVADAGNKVVMRFDVSGRLIGYIGRGKEATEFQKFIISSPYFDVAVEKGGSLWVVNPGRHSLLHFTQDGRFITSWGYSSTAIDGFCGSFNPSHIAITGGGVFVTSETSIPRVKVYDENGEFIGIVAGPEQFKEGSVGLDLAVDSQGRVIVLDPNLMAVRIFLEKTS
jgi:sugar lactone lactonase YvrE